MSQRKIVEKTDDREYNGHIKIGMIRKDNHRVNFAVVRNQLSIDAQKKQIILELDIDEELCSMYDYFDIFLGRMLLSRAAAEKILGVKFKIRVNGNNVL